MTPDRRVSREAGARSSASHPRGSRRIIASVAVFVLWGGMLLVGATAVFGRVEGYRLFAIRSGSMTPALRVGDLIIDRDVPAAGLRPGQLVTFRDPDLGRQLVTHRVVSVQRKGPLLHLETKGDANTTPEKWTVPAGAELGRTVTHVPWVGRWLLEPRQWLAVAAVLLLSLTAGFHLLALLARRLGRPNPAPVAPTHATKGSRGPARHRHTRRRNRRRHAATLTSVLLLLSAVTVGETRAAWTAADSPSASSFGTAVSFSSFSYSTCSSSPQTLAVPTGKSSATVTLVAGQGATATGGTGPGAGGQGATVTLTFPIAGGSDTLNVYIGCQGSANAGGAGYSSGGNGGSPGSGTTVAGGGGGASAICKNTCSNTNLMAVAGGGGGGGGGTCSAATSGTGGVGASSTSGTTSNPAGTYHAGNVGAAGSSGGGGGAGGAGASNPPTNGTAGGNGTSTGEGGGGGGGGYNGGAGSTGASNCTSSVGGGGGGSSWFSGQASTVSMSNGGIGNGTVTVDLN